MRIKLLYPLALTLLLPLAAAAQKRLIAEASPHQEQKDLSPAYWQINYGVPQAAYTYNISLETQDVEATEEKIGKLAKQHGMSHASSPYAAPYGSGQNRMFVFNTEPKKAEAFCQQVITLAKLKNYSTYQNTNDTYYNEAKKKYARIKEEYEGNKALYEKLPIARTLIWDLSLRYKSYLAGYEAAADRASVTITLAYK